MKNLQDLLDRAHKAAGLPPQRDFVMTPHFKETGDDAATEAHQTGLRKKAESDEVRRQVRLGMNMLLAAADGLAVLNHA